MLPNSRGPSYNPWKVRTPASQQSNDAGSSSGRKVATPPIKFPEESPRTPIVLESTGLALSGRLFLPEKKDEKPPIRETFEQKIRDQPKIEKVAPLAIALPPEKSPEELTKYYGEKFRANKRINPLKNDFWPAAPQQSIRNSSTVVPPPIEVPEESPLPPINMEYTEVMPSGPLFLKEKKDKKPLILEAFEQKIREQPKIEEVAPREQKTEQEEDMNKVQKTREDYQNKTRKIMEETFKEAQQKTEALYQSFQMKLTFEEREKECSEWLKAMRAPIIKAKNYCSRLETDYGNRKVDDFEKDFLMNDVLRLHYFTLIAWQTVFGAYQKAKSLFVQFQKNYLRIILDNLVTVCDKLFYVLLEIDKVLNENQSIQSVFQKFISIEPTEIMTTWELQEISSNFEAIKDPIVYSNSFVNIEEEVPNPII